MRQHNWNNIATVAQHMKASIKSPTLVAPPPFFEVKWLEPSASLSKMAAHPVHTGCCRPCRLEWRWSHLMLFKVEKWEHKQRAEDFCQIYCSPSNHGRFLLRFNEFTVQCAVLSLCSYKSVALTQQSLFSLSLIHMTVIIWISQFLFNYTFDLGDWVAYIHIPQQK